MKSVGAYIWRKQNVEGCGEMLCYLTVDDLTYNVCVDGEGMSKREGDRIWYMERGFSLGSLWLVNER